MKLYGSLDNRYAESVKAPEAKIGMGVTEMLWSDRVPYEVVEIINPKRIVIRALDYERTDNNHASELQSYRYISNEKNTKKILFKNKFGQWKECHHSKGSTFCLGYAERYYDYSF